MKIQQTFGGILSKEYIEKKTLEKKEENFETKLKEMQQEKLQNLMELEMSEKRVKLILKEAVLFDSGSAVLKEEAKKVLLPVVDELKKLPNEIMIEGHTDNVPIKGGRYSNNFELSMARAYSVIEFMQSHNIDPKRLSGIGYGEHRPIAENTTAEGRAKNRRIEISLLKGQ
ncbi:MAG: OmpA family protein [Elusimicrobiota bacterium]